MILQVISGTEFLEAELAFELLGLVLGLDVAAKVS